MIKVLFEQENLVRVFERFFHSDNSRNKKKSLIKNVEGLWQNTTSTYFS
jgi:hypothetical protein